MAGVALASVEKNPVRLRDRNHMAPDLKRGLE